MSGINENKKKTKKNEKKWRKEEETVVFDGEYWILNSDCAFIENICLVVDA